MCRFHKTSDLNVMNLYSLCGVDDHAQANLSREAKQRQSRAALLYARYTCVRLNTSFRHILPVACDEVTAKQDNSTVKTKA